MNEASKTQLFYQQLEALNGLFDDTAAFLQGHGDGSLSPQKGSIAATELETAEPQSCWNVYGQGTVLFEATADQFAALARTLTSPVLTIAPWSTLRTLLESAALTCWFMDPAIDVRERITRSYTYRIYGLQQQEKLGRARGAGLEKARERKLKLKTAGSQELGFEIPAMVTATDLVKAVLNEEVNYRLCSAVTHGQPWALQELGFKISTRQLDYARSVRIQPIEKHLAPESGIYLCACGAVNFSRAVWSVCRLFGYDLDKLGALMDRRFDEMKIRSQLRIWR